MTRYGLYLAVLPTYRSACMAELRALTQGDVRVFVSTNHLDPTVRTDSTVDWYERVAMHRLFRKRMFLQTGHYVDALKVQALIVDLNPRSITSWTLLSLRRLLRRRTLVWGHLYPQAGGESRTAYLRRCMRRLASGTISYTWSDLKSAQIDLPRSPAWVAPNSLYASSYIQPSTASGEREVAVYVGRFVPEKKVDVLVRAVAEARRRAVDIRLRLIGDGVERAALERLTAELDIRSQVEFSGWIDDPVALRQQYGDAFCSVSPGFAGLGLTQSAGFGIPMVVSRDEKHSPEIELSGVGAVSWFETDSPESLADALIQAYRTRAQLPLLDLSRWVRQRYSAEAMANGLFQALRGEMQTTDESGAA